LAQAQADRTARESRQLTAKEANVESLPEVLDDANVRAFQSQLATLQGRMLELGAIYASEHYKVRQVQDQIKAMEEKIQHEKVRLRERIENDFVTAKRREDMLEGIYEAQLRALVEQKPRLIQYNLLKREVESNRVLYEAMQQKVKTLKIAGGLRATNVRVLDVAQPGSQPDRPNVKRNVLTGLVTASFLGILLALFRENATRKVMSSPGEVRQKFNVPELGVILSSAQPKRLLLPAIGESATGNGMELVAWQQKASIQAESVRSVVASILARRIEKSVMVITSPCPREGKTAVTANLAAALADTNRRVLVIDADLHNPSMHKIFDVPNTWGLSDLASSDNPVETYPLDALVRRTDLESLFVLPSGPGTANTIRLLYSSRLTELLKRFRKEFDIVLIDTPPMIEIADARVLARQADGVVLVLRAGITTVELAHAALERLAQDGTPIVGTILNDWNPRVQNFPYGHRYGVTSWARPGA
jgi:polysaccharide biosynthesis transport protein